jgi:hypothetical protein
MNGSYSLSPFAPGVLEGESRDAARCPVSDYLEAFDDAGHNLVLKT